MSSPIITKPLCECHGEEMGWKTDRKMKVGGFWRCKIKHRQEVLQWQKANPEKCRAKVLRYARSEKGKETMEKWRISNPDKVYLKQTRELTRRKRQRLEEAIERQRGIA